MSSTDAPSILVVEDDVTVAEVVVTYLRNAGYATTHATDGETALRLAGERWPDLVVLDLMLPGVDGLEVCRRLRAKGSVPVIMLTALSSEDDRIAGLELGADDYVTKPFSPRELVLRVRSVLRRGVAASEPVGEIILRDGELELDVRAHRATLRGEELALTVREFDLLAFLLAHPGQAFSRSELLERVWGWTFGDHSTVTVHVRRLREKVEDNPAEPTRLLTVWGVGYRWGAMEPAS
ncbi:response regulator transcription factor [Tenggerimyces flavus]|uniref:Response regulator transcription factor n=1 Tax=Tenggerimyces flavus TaxID=1708749 RepID=A0ABV7Y595_9ACTN|nr:response regulator transcription factor [Tenggerimyces flavus]MBM7788221.1 DNA-binding response OmpR family regulator [Tenggerimyces flavus]